MPGVISLVLLALALALGRVERGHEDWLRGLWGGVFAVPYDTAVALLTTLAGGALTTLGLVYSLVLVVFTTAAGNIGPRLLQRFTNDRLNQVTAGLFGGTFMFALATLYASGPDRVPTASLLVTLGLAVWSVLQLIVFVQRAAQSVTVDVEVADISGRMEEEILRLVETAGPSRARDECALPAFPDDEGHRLFAGASGYVAAVDVAALMDWAETHDAVVEVLHGAGDFVLESTPLVAVDRAVSGEKREALEAIVDEAVPILPSRTPEADIEFSVHLLVEIALRALSPGVNDTYTAIACVDRLSAALAVPVTEGLPGPVRLATAGPREGEPCLVLPVITVEGVLDVAFDPLRRAARGNVLMLRATLDALARLHALVPPAADAAGLLRRHARLVMDAARRSDLLEADLDGLQRRYARLARPDGDRG